MVCVDAKDHSTLISNTLSGLQEGREYIVYGILDACCSRQLDVGLVNFTTITVIACLRCGKRRELDNTSVWYASEWRFRKVEERTIEYTAEIKIDIPEPVLS